MSGTPIKILRLNGVEFKWYGKIILICHSSTRRGSDGKSGVARPFNGLKNIMRDEKEMKEKIEDSSH